MHGPFTIMLILHWYEKGQISILLPTNMFFYRFAPTIHFPNWPTFRNEEEKENRRHIRHTS